jgi:hypothetical protein
MRSLTDISTFLPLYWRFTMPPFYREVNISCWRALLFSCAFYIFWFDFLDCFSPHIILPSLFVYIVGFVALAPSWLAS